ncbi:sigma-E processing peptidase SpoIIGA [Ornithinibacillus bavariensis]|uniref:Sporulation sigma-E factor-processing peptidase n=1 Tax=Ornithinibacillus bavariensis TaxID=545502 RepID=A0A919X7P7_9BACI|nr:sigma-E processing peptidase SpoIIGA [Ornithinibacillus bavariensis]GIO26070.1 sporulation sigma-E factor-processing peptidase [Ornithinibacillus bavariensis]
MTIYLDAVWVLNLLLDLMLLMLTQALSRVYTLKRRLVIGAIVASLIVPATIYYPSAFLNTVYGKLLYSILIILVTFQFTTIRLFLKQLLMFYFVTFSIGGGLFAAHYLLQNPVALSVNGILTFSSGLGDPVSWIFIIIGFPIAFWFTKSRMDKHVVDKIRYDQIYDVTLQIRGIRFSTTGYVDSGNQLVDPLTKKPVIICDESFLQQWFQEDDWIKLKGAFENFDIDKIPVSWEKYIQIVPFHGVEGKSNFLFALKPEELSIRYGEQKIIATKFLVGIQFSTLTKDQSYHCLLHPQIIKLATIHSA